MVLFLIGIAQGISDVYGNGLQTNGLSSGTIWAWILCGRGGDLVYFLAYMGLLVSVAQSVLLFLFPYFILTLYCWLTRGRVGNSGRVKKRLRILCKMLEKKVSFEFLVILHRNIVCRSISLLACYI